MASYATTDIYFAAALQCALGEESLVQITRSENSGIYRGNPIKKYVFDVPSLDDAASMYTDYLRNNLGVSDIRENTRVYSRLTKICKYLERDGLDSWEGPAWVAGKDFRRQRD